MPLGMCPERSPIFQFECSPARTLDRLLGWKADICKEEALLKFTSLKIFSELLCPTDYRTCWHCPGLPGDFLALRNYDHCWDRANGISGCDCLLCFSVQFPQSKIGFKLARRRTKSRGHLHARATPRGPEINEQRYIALRRMRIKIGTGESDRLCLEEQ